MLIGNKEFDTKHHTYIMGILNVTPDSFSDGGNYVDLDKALYRVEEMISQGVDIIDIGGESTRPGYVMISEGEEIDRVCSTIESIKKRFDIPLSLDTYKSKVAKVGIDVGVDMINDIWGLQYDENMAKVVADGNVACCLMHNRKESGYQVFMQDVFSDLASSIVKAKEVGIGNDKIILDPGVGFGKNYEQNMEVIQKINDFQKLGYPLLLGVSRKSVIGLTLNLPVEERLPGTLALSAYGILQGCSFLRVHDVKENKEVVIMLEALKDISLKTK
ncbi:MAG: dihydropteroate synthase [Lachnospiraceae bacterium]|nr:dihydropteroate synthase [Lachnospiraceae bacterium]